ncbi:aminoglycoside phosphotransferase family protein [Aestuariispira insulae]|uniref:Phosphotransferase family enzyme n=1 Tax=Aestuariispira insulae TaxID=1461337 RepID=A0A3D9H9E7_9PROT|nr:aminoglycoside phosphotransferase family protein [Aestuariispira insulae]RED45801.1 phosphotransferase family enzyme [Aestuariispira insulae]
MQLPIAVRDNLFFLLSETASQVANLQVLLETLSDSVGQRILDRTGYSYNLNMRIHDGCARTLRRSKKDDVDIYSLRAAESIASSLEQITALTHDCVRLVLKLDQADKLKKRPHAAQLEEVMKGIGLIEKAVEKYDTRLALKIGNIERKLDRAYDKLYQEHLKELRKTKHAEEVVTSLFVGQRIAEMGDVLLLISEAIISARLGQPMHMERFRSLETALSDLGLKKARVEPLAATKSGSGISGISDPDADDKDYVAIFKDGKKDKMLEERDSVESWHEIFPGLAPQIFSYKKQGKHASLLIEHLPGRTFEQIVLQNEDDLLGKALKHLTKTLNAVWVETKSKKIYPACHIGQLRKRLDSVIDLHPDFRPGPVNINGCSIKSMDQLLDQAEKLEEKYPPPFSVYIHGDFNLDNIIFDPQEKSIRFIDLHRSRYMDYVQDVAVFMVSNYRLQALDKPTRERIRLVASQIYAFAADFADKNKDRNFEIRLALGLARSFITSTRFILDQTLASNMFWRGQYLLKRVGEIKPKTARAFRLPVEELFK